MAVSYAMKSLTRFRDSKLVRRGIAGLVFGSGPLLLAVVVSHLRGDPNPNPIGPGLLCAVTYRPSLILVLIGCIKSSIK
jgi:hypothetical protein